MMFPFEFSLWLRTQKSRWLVRDVIDIQQGHASNELADRGRMIKQRQEERSLFFEGGCLSGAKA